MIGFELWQTSNSGLREHASIWLDHLIHAALATTDREARGGGIGFARVLDGVDHEVPYSPEEWDRRKAEYERGELAERVMELRGLNWNLEATAELHGVPSPGSAVTHLATFLNREGVSSEYEPFFDRELTFSEWDPVSEVPEAGWALPVVHRRGGRIKRVGTTVAIGRWRTRVSVVLT